MQVEALSIFCDVVRFQSFSRGALANSVSQSAASQTIRQIEKQLGTQLIDRSKRPWQLTSEGQTFFKGCQEIVERYHELEEAVQRSQEPTTYTIRLASIYSIRRPDLSSYINNFSRSVPGASVNVQYMRPDEVCANIKNGQSDLGLISFANPSRDLTVVPWQAQAMVITCLPSHKFAQRSTAVGPWELSGEPFITFDRQLPIRRELDRYLKRHGADVSIVAEFDNIENIKEAVEDGTGLAVLPQPSVRREVQRESLIAVSIDPLNGEAPFVRPLSIIYRRNRRLNPTVSKFVELLRLANIDYEPTLEKAAPSTRNRSKQKLVTTGPSS